MLALLLSLVPALAGPTVLPPGSLSVQDVPANQGWVTDQAGLLSAGQEAELEALAESFRRGSGNQIAVLTVKSLDGRSLEGLSLDTARAWMGEDADRGALLLVAHEDRSMRIEVGRDLEGNLTDSISGRIIRDVIAPRFKQGAFPEGIREGMLAMHAAVGGDYAPIEAATQRREESGAAQALSSLCSIGFLLLFILPSILGGRRGYRRGGSVLPWLILGSMAGGSRSGGGGFSGGGFGGFSGGGGGFGGGGASGSW